MFQRVLVAACIVSSLAASSPRAEALPGLWARHRIVAHGNGVPRGTTRTYCNCVEAWDESYRKGMRLFEVDWVLLRDGVPYASHTGNQRRVGLPRGTRFGAVSSKTLKHRLVDGKLHPLWPSDAITLLERDSDAYHIVDAKGGEDLAIARYLLRLASSRVRNRMIFYAWTPQMVDELRAFGARHFMIPAWKLRNDPNLVARAVRLTGIDTVVAFSRTLTDEGRMTMRAAGALWLYVEQGYRDNVDPKEDEKIAAWYTRGVGVFSNSSVGPLPKLLA